MAAIAQRPLPYTTTRTRVIGHPAPKVFSVLRNLEGVHKFHPRVRSSPLITPHNDIGATRLLQFNDKSDMMEVLIHVEQDRELRLELINVDHIPLRKAYASLRTDAIGSDQCKAVFSVNYDVRFGPLGDLVDALVCRPRLNEEFEAVLEGLQRHLDTGELIDEESGSDSGSEDLLVF